MNTLVGCYMDGKYEEDVVLIRKYGNNTSLLVDRKAEIDILTTLSQEGVCKPLYATLNNGIAYGFVHGETLTVDSVRDEHIARFVRNIDLHKKVSKFDPAKIRTFTVTYN